MPEKLTAEFVRKQFEKYGFVLPDDFKYTNNREYYWVLDLMDGEHKKVSYKTLQNRINRGRPVYVPPETRDLMNLPLSEKEVRHKSSFDRWLQNSSDSIKTLPPDEQKIVYESYTKSIKSLAKKKQFILDFDEYDNVNQLRGFVEAAKTILPNIKGSDIRLSFVDDNGNIDYRMLSPNTMHYLDDLFNKGDIDRIKDSTDESLDTILDTSTLIVEFVPKKEGKRVTAGFFPYVNVSDIDLKKYGIFNSIEDNEYNESCLVHAFKCSGLLSDDELKMLKSQVKTRMIPRSQLKLISDLFNIHINLKIYYEETEKTSHSDFGIEFKEKKSINLMIMKNHYMLNERTNVSELYVKKYNEINNDPRFTNHSRKMLLQKFDDKRYAFAKQGMSIVQLIKVMIENKLLIPLSDDEINKSEWSFVPQEYVFDGLCRKVVIKDKNDTMYRKMSKVNQTKHFFGYKPEEDEVDMRLNELQNIINSLPLRKHINVRLYYKFSELMQKVMYEYGCYDGVYEFSGQRAKSIRNECVFPKTRTYNDKPFYSNERLYYIDLNGAYMSAITSIPTGKGDHFTGVNSKIKDLIEQLYKERTKAKEEGNEKLAKTLKFMMNSCWGYSIQRQKVIKHKYTNNVNEYVETYAPFVMGYKYNKDGKSGFVDTINSFVPHFTIPHFARSVLNNFNEKMNEIKSLVTVYYENVDAILINENDYNKLIKLGYIGKELGQFKIEHVFIEIAIKSAKKYVGTLDNGNKFFHCVKGNISYNEFINSVKQLL